MCQIHARSANFEQSNEKLTNRLKKYRKIEQPIAQSRSKKAPREQNSTHSRRYNVQHYRLKIAN